MQPDIIRVERMHWTAKYKRADDRTRLTQQTDVHRLSTVHSTFREAPFKCSDKVRYSTDDREDERRTLIVSWALLGLLGWLGRGGFAPAFVIVRLGG